jgi:hypothetical protein
VALLCRVHHELMTEHDWDGAHTGGVARGQPRWPRLREIPFTIPPSGPRSSARRR